MTDSFDQGELAKGAGGSSAPGVVAPLGAGAEQPRGELGQEGIPAEAKQAPEPRPTSFLARLRTGIRNRIQRKGQAGANIYPLY